MHVKNVIGQIGVTLTHVIEKVNYTIETDNNNIDCLLQVTKFTDLKSNKIEESFPPTVVFSIKFTFLVIGCLSSSSPPYPCDVDIHPHNPPRSREASPRHHHQEIILIKHKSFTLTMIQ